MRCLRIFTDLYFGDGIFGYTPLFCLTNGTPPPNSAGQIARRIIREAAA